MFLKIKLYIYKQNQQSQQSQQKLYLDEQEYEKIRRKIILFDSNIKYFGLIRLYVEKIIGIVSKERYLYIDKKKKDSILDILFIKYFI